MHSKGVEITFGFIEIVSSSFIMSAKAINNLEMGWKRLSINIIENDGKREH